MVIWITGISGAGKSTIARALMQIFKDKVPELINIDGDTVRDVFDEKLGYTENDRKKHIKRIQRLCLLLDKQEQVVITSALYSNKDILSWNRKNFSEYYEIYLDVSVELAQKRDTKGLYDKYKKGLEKNIVGLDIPWQHPEKPDLKIDFINNYSVEEVVKKIVQIVPIFKNITSSENIKLTFT